MNKMVLYDEYDESVKAFTDDGFPGLRTAAVAWGIAASVSPMLLTVSGWFLPLVLFACILELVILLDIVRHRRTIRRWREQEAERLSRIEAEKFLKEHKS